MYCILHLLSVNFEHTESLHVKNEKSIWNPIYLWTFIIIPFVTLFFSMSIKNILRICLIKSLLEFIINEKEYIILYVGTALLIKELSAKS